MHDYYGIKVLFCKKKIDFIAVLWYTKEYECGGLI